MIYIGSCGRSQEYTTWIEQCVTNNKKSIQETKQGEEKFVQKVDNLTYEAKVVVGLEQPKPSPPPPPPLPKSTKDMAMDVAGAVVKTTGKLALDYVVIVGKGTIRIDNKCFENGI